MKSTESKIFGIGLSKTGTTSLASALSLLGYKTIDNPGISHYAAGDLASIDKSILDKYEAFTDTPIPSFYHNLDEKFPGSKFILTVRDIGGWSKSCKKQFTQRLADKQNEAHNQLFLDLYDSMVFDERKFVRGYRNFVGGVIQHFENRTQDLLVLNIAAGEGWEKLCPFLGRPIPEFPFPKANVTRVRWMNIHDITTMAQQSGREAFGIYNFLHPGPNVSSSGGIGFLRTLRYLFLKLRYRLTCDNRIPRSAAWELARQIIERRLHMLNPQIPIVFPDTSGEVSHATRHKWNHFWLVDPLNYGTSKDGCETNFTTCISLIEDRIPILGVVYLPGSDTTYYSMSGKEAFRINDKGESIPLDELRKQHHSSDQSPIEADPPHDSLEIGNAINTTLSMCLVASGELDAGCSLPKNMEWETAAAQAILKASGMQVLDCQNGEPLCYNKADFANDCIIIE